MHTLSRFLVAPHICHWDAAPHVLRYLKGSLGQGIVLRPLGNMQLTSFCDSDWAACPLTRCSVTGYLVFLGRSLVSWKTKKQPTMDRSFEEAEYRALVCELMWLIYLLSSLGILHPKHTRLCSYSQLAIHISKNPVFHDRTKHIEVDCRFIRDELTSGNLSTSYVPTGSGGAMW